MTSPDGPAAGPPALAEGRRRGSVAQLVGTAYFTTLVGLVTGPIAARVLGPEGRGEYAAAMIYGSTAVFLLAFGLGSSVKHAVLTQHQDPGVVYGLSLRFSVALLPLSILVGFGAAELLSGLSDVVRIGVFLLVATAPLGVLQMAQLSLINSEGALGPIALIRITPIALNAVGVVVLALVGHLTVATYLALALGTNVAAVAVSAWLVRTRPRGGGQLRPLLSFGIRAYPGSLASVANQQLDQLLIAPILSTRDLGFYAVAVTVASLPLGVTNALSVRSLRDATRPGGGVDPERCAQNIREAVTLVTAVSVALAICTPVLVPVLYGSSFHRVILLCLVLLPGTVALTITSIAGQSLIVAGRPGATSSAQLISLLVTVAGLAVSVPTIGALGAAITSSVAYWVRALLQLRALRREGVSGFVPRSTDVRQAYGLVSSRLHRLRRSKV